jgi:Tfp pilus assembly protein PilF
MRSMRKSKRIVEKAGSGARPAFELLPWHYALALGTALGAVLAAYGPALGGEYVFDDLYLYIFDPGFATFSLRQLLHLARPLLAITFWANLRLFGADPLSYHLVNVVCHFAVSVVVFLAARKLLAWAGTNGILRSALAAFAGGLFLLHPLQTESVAYITSRSETLSVLFCYGALVAFLYRRSQAISWPVTAVVLVLFGLAAQTKEHTVMLPLVLLLTDYYWNPGFSFRGILRNWRLYAPIALGSVLAAKMVLRILRGSDSAGSLANTGATWAQYLYTQCRAIWVYVRLFFLPYGQRVDYDFPVSRSPAEYGAVFGMIALVALAVAAFWFRRRFPLASYGYFMFLILLAPTSSVLPIADRIAERRMYLPMLGLLLIVLEFLRRWKIPARTMAAVLAGCLLVAGVLTYQRSHVWASAQALWEDAAEKSPRKPRVQAQLAFAYYMQNRCADALAHYQIAAGLDRPTVRLLTNWAAAYDCLHRDDEALDKLLQARARSNDANVNSLIGMTYIKQGKRAEAFAALNSAVRLDPSFESTYVFRGALYLDSQEWNAAAVEFRRALSLDPADQRAQTGLQQAERGLKGLP